MVVVIVALTGCNRLSSEAKEMIGQYYVPEISQDVPIMDLREDGRCTVSAVKPNVLTYSVDGKWNVKDDVLKIDLDPKTLTFEGDSTLIGEIEPERRYPIVSYNGITLEVKHDGLTFSFHRRVKPVEE